MKDIRKIAAYGMIAVLMIPGSVGCGNTSGNSRGASASSEQIAALPSFDSSGEELEAASDILVGKTELTAAAGEIIASLNEEWERIKTKMNASYSGYLEQKQAIHQLFTLSLSSSEQFYELIESHCADAYREITESGEDLPPESNELLEHCFKDIDDIMSDYYESWDKLYDDVFTECSNIIRNAPDRAASEEADAQWEELLDTFQVHWEAQYEQYSKAWRSLYQAYDTVWWEVYNSKE